MYGFEFAGKRKHHKFPKYDIKCAVSPKAIDRIAPLVWQEHCVECAMPLCYKTCVHYKRRIDNRCRLFKYGIERIENKDAILGQNVIIDMNEWAKLETFWFTSGFSYKKLLKINSHVSKLGALAQVLKIGKLRRFCYYVKEYYTRKIGDKNDRIPQFFLCEIVNEGKQYVLNLENRANEQIVYRTKLVVKKGFNRFWIQTKDLNFVKKCRNNLYFYPDGNIPKLVNIVSLELITLKPEYFDIYFPPSKKKVKCVVWDLDNTIWDGILGEDGIGGIKLKNDIVDIIEKLDAKGIINSIVSKNYENQAIEALKKFGLYDYFVCPMINWDAKSKNIKTLVKVLDIGIDTFVFVDDSFFERNEVRSNCPEIRVCDVNDIQKYVQKDFFDVPITEESKRRRASYKEIAVRNKAAAEFDDNIIDFLKSCHMVMHVTHPKESELIRCYELIQRTNQLNISGKRLGIDEIRDITKSDNYDCYRIKVDDKFGDYGLVGFAIFDVSRKGVVVLRHFVFSCRAARKNIEQSFFEYMIDIYGKQGYKKLQLICKITEKNHLMRQVLEESGLFEKIKSDKFSFVLEHRMIDISSNIGIVSIVND